MTGTMTTAVSAPTTDAPSSRGAFDALHAALRGRAQRERRSTTIWAWVIRAVAAVVLIGGWQLMTTSGMVNEAIASSPVEVWDYLVATLPTETLWLNLWSTLQATVIGLAAGAIAGIVAGVVLFELPTLRRGLNPFITFLNSLPRPALAPIFLLWFGLGLGAKVSVSVSIVVFVLLLNTLAGLQATNADHMLLANSLGMSRLQRLLKIQLPAAMPVIMAGLRLATVYSMLGVVVSEMVASELGLGQLLVIETNSFNVGGAFGILMILGFLAMCLNSVVSLIERRFDW